MENLEKENKTKKKEDSKNLKEVVVNGKNLSLSLKHAIALCNLVRGKDIDRSIKMIEEVIKMKRAVPMRGEIPHRKGMMSGRYPVEGAKIMLGLLKSLKSNAISKDIEIERYEIFSMSNLAFRPYKKFGQGRIKRAHITLKLKAIKNKEVKK